jgi:hypothetical protein
LVGGHLVGSEADAERALEPEAIHDHRKDDGAAQQGREPCDRASQERPGGALFRIRTVRD